MSGRFFIDDGYTLSDVIPAKPGLHDELRFTFRPATSREAERLQDEVNKGARRDADSEVSSMGDAQKRFVVAHLVEWNASAKPTVEEMHRLPSQLFSELFDRVYRPQGVKGEEEREGNS